MAYSYSPNEILIGKFLTVLSHVPMIILPLLMVKKKHHFECVAGFFTISFSFFYHLAEIDDSEIITISTNWHRLDNIAALMSLNMMLLNSINASKQFRLNFVYISCVFTWFFQIADPFNGFNTLVTMCATFVFIFAFNLYSGWRVTNRKMLVFAIAKLSSGAFFFYKGLDDNNDYLRYNHHIWHLFISIGSFDLWQIHDESPISIKESFGFLRSMFLEIY